MRIAAIQCPAIPDDDAAVRDIVVQRLRWAETEGIDLVVFPEAFLLGHSYDEVTIAARARKVAARSLAALCDDVADFPATLVIGAFHLADERIVNRAFVIAGGRVVGHYAKAHPNEPGVAAGEDFPVFVRAGWRYGINICNDANHAATAATIGRQGADLILYPLNNMLPPATAERWRARSIANLVDRARENGCWVVSADVAGTNGDLVSHGCTAIVAPDGHVVARIPESTHGAVVFDLSTTGRR